MLTLQRLQISSALSQWVLKSSPPGGFSAIFSSFSFLSLLATDKISSCYFIVCGSSSFKDWHTVDSLPHSSSRSLFFLSFFVSLFFQLHTWHSLALIRTTPHWLALDHTSVNILFLRSPLYGCVPHMQLSLSCFSLYSSHSQGGGVFL